MPRKATCALLIASLAMLALPAGPGGARADTIHEGHTIYGHAVWTAAGNDHIVTGTIAIHGDGSLTIGDGCVVRFETGTYLNVNGTLSALGTSGDGVLFTRRDATDEWSGLSYNSTSGGLLQYCTIEHATRYDGIALYANGAMPAI